MKTVLLGIGALLAVGVLLFLVKVALRMRKPHRIRAIRQMAKRLGFMRITAKGVERTTTSISVSQHREYAFENVYSGVVAGLSVAFFDMVSFQYSTETSARGGLERTEATTRIKVHLKGQTLQNFILVPQASVSAMMHRLPKTDPITFPDDKAFNRDNVLLGDDSRAIGRLFDSPALRAMFAGNEATCLEGKRDTLTAYLCNTLLSAGQLESLIERAVKIAGLLNFKPKA